MAPNKFTGSLMQKISKAMLESNAQPLFIIRDSKLNQGLVKSIILTIRKFNKMDPILIHGQQMPLVSYNLFNFYSVGKGKYDISEVGAYCNNGKNKISKLNSWSVKNGFLKKLELPSSFKGTFNGAGIVYSFVEVPTFTRAIGKDAQGRLLLEGREYEVIKLLSKLMQK